MKAVEDLVLLDGHSFVSEWPRELAESLLADPTPWWGSWPGDPTDKPNRGTDFTRIANCVYGYARYTKLPRLKVFNVDPSDFSGLYSNYSTQQLLDAIFFVFRREVFGYGNIRGYEPSMRKALQEVVRRVHSEHPPCFLAVTRLTYSLMHGNKRLGVLTPYEYHFPWTTCQFAADSAFIEFLPLFEEAYQLTKNLNRNDNSADWEKAYEKVDALDLYLIRKDGTKGEMSAIHIHDETASLRPRRTQIIFPGEPSECRTL